MYNALRFNAFETTSMFSFNTKKSFIKTMMINDSPFISGYHGFKRMFYSINTFAALLDNGYVRNNDGTYLMIDEKLIRRPKEDVIPNFETDDHNNIIHSLIWRDCGYYDPINDYKNIEKAISKLYEAYSNEEDENTPDLQKIRSYIRQLKYPRSLDKSKIPDDLIIQTIRDCDLSMILYEDYFADNGLFHKLITHEFKGLLTSEIEERCTYFIENLQFFSTFLNKVLGNLGRDYLMKQTYSAIIKFRRIS